MRETATRASNVVKCCAVLLLISVFGCLTVKWYESPSDSTNDELAARKATRYRSNSTQAYGVMVDCGSSGSRVFVFGWPTKYEPDQLLKIRELASTNKRPGLSSFEKKSAQQIEDYLRPLVQFALDRVPKDQLKWTPFYLLCTAGMRKLVDLEKERILNIVREFIKREYQFEFENYYVEVISGKQEAVYSWITANYLLDQFKPLSGLPVDDTRRCRDSNFVCIDNTGEFIGLNNNVSQCVAKSNNFNLSESQQRQAEWEKRHCRLRSFGMVEMGGASMQIAFELSPRAVNTFRAAGVLPPDNQENSYTVDLNLGCSDDSALKYYVYVTTYLNYGAVSARDRYHLSFMRNLTRPKGPAKLVYNGTDPCLPKGRKYEKSFSSADLLPYTLPEYGLNLDTSVNMTVSMVGSGDYDKCLQGINASVMHIKCQPCSVDHSKPNHCGMTDNCTILSYWQPTIAFQKQPFYAFSDFYYRYSDLYQLKGAYNASLFRQHNAAYCSKTYDQILADYNRTVTEWISRKGHDFAQGQIESQCFQAAYDYAVLHYGYKFPLEYKDLTPAGDIDGVTLQWTLGAMLYKTRFYPLRYKPAAFDQVLSGGSKLSLSLATVGVMLLVNVLLAALWHRPVRSN